VQGDILNFAALDAAFAQHRPSAVIHFAALASAASKKRTSGHLWGSRGLQIY
jgi:UDP-glucose 4-epimerase